MHIDLIVDAMYEKCIELSNNSNNDDSDLDYYRNYFEPYIYQYLTYKYGSMLEAHWNTHEFPVQSKYAWVFVERRAHPNTWFLLRNIAWAGPSFSLYIFCSDMNYKFIMDCIGDKKNIIVIPWFKGFVSREEGKEQYNQTFKSHDFYGLIDAEYILTIQTDCFFRKKIPTSIFQYDYYGAPWIWAQDMPGGGGITVRKISTMLDLTRRIPYSEGAEDGWIADKVKEIGGDLPSFNYIVNIFSENFPVQDPIGVHQFWTFINNFDINNPDLFRENIQRYLTFDV